ncbi:snurportin-1-like [Panonychus citri]|uniref:snurportin-1-like n=1 Tax=Panonychus citri TaxID=50023 RepID=UPI00230818B6|nr:snurportin-1-like [Panonychus citri]
MTCNTICNPDLGDIIEKLNVGLEVSRSTKIFNPHYALYKNKANGIDIQKRREQFLINQKSKRKENLMKIRRLTSISIDDGDSLDGDNDRENCGETSDESMDTTATKSVKSSHVKEEKFNMYKDQLMLSEWLTEKPFDFIDNWFLVLCPIGKRCLVIASSGQTKAYSRTGHFISSFPSYLPGGNRRDNCAHRKSAILDCIYSELDKTYYILDVMLWNQSHFYDSETDLRFYWLNCKIREEYSKVSTTDHLNPYKFILLDHYNCDNQSIIKAITSYSLKPKIDGLLFFHKKSHYIPEVSPLVCWLKLNMIKDILGIELDLTNQSMDVQIED